MLTIDEARRWFSYDPQTGVIRWIARRSGVAVGGVAGTANRYIWIKFNGRYVAGHKIAWLFHYGEWPSHQIDHINGNTTDNRIENLRAATIAQNCMNRRVRSDNVAKLKGVRQKYKKWEARIWLNGKSVCLGTFDTALEAHAAYVKAAEKHFGEFARPG